MTQKAPAIAVDPDWEEFQLPFAIGSGRTLASGAGEDSRLRVRFFRRKSSRKIVGRVWFGEGAEGPPLHAHGGAIAYILDEAMGTAAWAEDFPVVAAELKFDYFQMTPLFEDHTLEAWVEQRAEKRVTVKARIILADGKEAARATGQFHILKKSRIQVLMQLVPKNLRVRESQLLSPALKWAPDETN